MTVRWGIVGALLALLAPAAHADPIAKELFGRLDAPSSQPPEPFGSYAKGCQAGAVQLPETGPRWQAMRLSRNRNWAQPAMVSFVERLSEAAVAAGWNGIYVGDMSQPRGGPMLTGHASHQIGLDADFWMLPPARLDLSAAERESISSVNVVTPDKRAVNGNWTPQHQAILMAALKDPAVARIFVSGAIKLQMCADVTPAERPFLRKLRPWWGHTAHFHVRLNCPEGAENCVEQAPPPPGDGCESAVWWVTEALEPPDPNAPPRKLKPELTLADLPAQCGGVLQSP